MHPILTDLTPWCIKPLKRSESDGIFEQQLVQEMGPGSVWFPAFLSDSFPLSSLAATRGAAFHAMPFPLTFLPCHSPNLTPPSCFS